MSFSPIIERHFVIIKSQTIHQSVINIKMPYMEKFNVNSNNPLHLVNDVLLSICDGINYIHSFDILHGGLKPNNLFVDESGNVLISDTYHRFLYPQNSYNLLMSNLYYSSPELLQSKPITKSSDIWSLGEIIYYCFNNCDEIIHSKDIKCLYKDICNMKSKVNYEKIPLLFQETLRKIFSVDSTERPSLEEVYNQLKKITLENCIYNNYFYHYFYE